VSQRFEKREVRSTTKGVDMISEEAKLKFSNAGYRIVGNHSAVEICHWTKESLRTNRVCYKEKWYDIQSHRCLEMTPTLIWCSHNCQFCWRPQKYTIYAEPEPDDPEEIINGCIEARRKLLMGFKGNKKVDRKRLVEAIQPTSAAISLAGEPTLYSRISDLLEAFQQRNMVTFLVTNGTRPNRLAKLDTEPASLYLSLCSPDVKTYHSIHRPLIDNGWIRVMKSLEIMKSFNCRTVIRLTLIKELNLKSVEQYAKLILKAEPDFVEPKGFMQIGEAQQRLPRELMPQHYEIVEFARNLAELLNYKFKNHHPESRVVLLSKK
jgi:tRNA wybutosine-synthesizing protein 1